MRAGSRLALTAAGNLVVEAATGPRLQPTSSGSTITLDLADTRLTLPLDHTVTYERP